MCRRRPLLCVKALLHCSHWWALRPSWNVFTWPVRWAFQEYALSHRLHLNGFTSLWMTSCCFRLWSRAKDFPHVEQVKFVTPECEADAIWLNNGHLSLNETPQSSQKNGFTSEWRWRLSMWRLRWYEDLKVFPHSVHWCGLSLEWINMWLLKTVFLEKVLPQSSHL